MEQPASQTTSPSDSGSTYYCELLTPERLQLLWPQLEPLFARCCAEAAKGELLAIDIYTMALQGRAYIFVERLDDEVTVALGLEVLPYPRMKIANVFALGGARLLSAKTRYWQYITDWLVQNGVVAIDASVSSRMEQLLTGRFGFETVYRQVRLTLGDDK